MATAQRLLSEARSLVVHLQDDGEAGAADEPGNPGSAVVAARVAEWSLGDQVELVPRSEEVSFEHAYGDSEK